MLISVTDGTVLDRELDEELQFHVDHLIETYVARGLSPDAARREALLVIGGVEQRKEECRDTRGVRLINDLLQDLQYAARTLRRAPAFTTAAILTLTLGIGTTVAMFSVVNGVIMRPLSFPEPERLHLLSLSPKSILMRHPGMADQTFAAYRGVDRAFQNLATFTTYNGNLTGAGDPVVIPVGQVTTEFFDALAVKPAMGRTFLPNDGQDGREPIVVMSDSLWRGRFGSDPAIIGRLVTLNAVRRTAIGLLSDSLDRSTAEPAFYARLLGAFAVLAVTLALVGTYGVIAYAVAQRNHEIGLRMALGARGASVVWLVIRRTLTLGMTGVVIGTSAAWLATRLLETVLFEVTPTDPATFAAVATAVFVATLLAGLVPARRATRVDPLALRHE